MFGFRKNRETKFVAMIDFLAIISIVFFYQYITTRDELEVAQAVGVAVETRYADLQKRHRGLKIEFDKIKTIGDQEAERNEELRLDNDRLNNRIEALISLVESLRNKLSDREETARRNDDDLERAQGELDRLVARLSALEREFEKCKKGEGSFVVADNSFAAGDFMQHPFDQLKQPAQAQRNINRILEQYKSLKGEFEYIFIVGHASEVDALTARDRSLAARRGRNFNYAGQRASLIAAQIARSMERDPQLKNQVDKLVVVSAGELDLRDPFAPRKDVNQWVEVVFGRHWKKPAAKGR